MTGFQTTGMWANLGAVITMRSAGAVTVEAVFTAASHGFPTSRGTIVHGGALAALADMAVASAAASLAAEAEAATTVDLRVDFLRVARPGRFVARAEVSRRTRRLCFASGRIEDSEGTVVAEATGVLAFVRAAESAD